MARKLTYEEVKHFIEVESGSECKLLSEEYVRGSDKLIIKCKCGNSFGTTFRYFNYSRKRKCDKCTEDKLKKIYTKTHEEFLSDFYKKYKKSEYLILERYIGSKTKIAVQHLVCGYKWKVKPNQLLSRNSKCPNCYANVLKNTETFEKEVFTLTGNEYKIIGDYINSKTKIKMRHCSCGHVFNMSPNSFLKGSRCPKCFGVKIKNTSSFKKEIKQLTQATYKVIGEYINSKTKIKFLHNQCGTEFYMTPSSFLVGQRCPRCRGSVIAEKLKMKDFSQKVFKLVGTDYIVLEEYQNANTKVKMLHKNCNSIFNAKPSAFLRGVGCPKCASSKGEKKIREFLINKKIFHEEQKTFKNCKDKLPLKFDFFIRKFLIEYDGEQHFYPVDFASKGKQWSRNSFKETQKRDKIKNQYCIDNGIPLIRIPYWEIENIEYILKNVLIHFNLVDTQPNTYDKEIVLKYLVDKNWNHDEYIDGGTKHK